MAIQWQLTLSDSQIALLQLINDWELDLKLGQREIRLEIVE